MATNGTAANTKTAAAESICDACNEASATLYPIDVSGFQCGAICGLCLDEEIRKSGDSAPGCYCSTSIRCDYCRGYSVHGVPTLNNPRAVQVAADRLRTRPMALSRWTTERLVASGFFVSTKRLQSEAA